MLLGKSLPSVAQQLLCACITADMRSHNTCCACVDQLMGAYSKPTLLADVFINHFATKDTVLFVILPEQPYLKETKKGMPH